MSSSAFQRHSTSPVPGRKRLAIPVRLLIAGGLFAVAFTVDVATDRQYSQVLGSAAIAGSALTLFPAIRPGLLGTGAVALVWGGFNLVRAVADDAGLALAGPDAVGDLERDLFGGTLPSAWLQDRWFDPDRIGAHDVALSLVHASFFVVPFAVAVIAWRRSRARFRRYIVATALCFAASAAAFVLLPTAPPWLSDPGGVARVTHRLLPGAASGTGGAAFWFEPNDLAALPSVHVATSVLVACVVATMGRWGRASGVLYALAMSLAVVYLGEHFMLDVVTGWLVALASWHTTHRMRSGASDHRRR